MARTEEEIQVEIDEAQEELSRLAKLPPAFSIHGQVIDNRERLRNLRFRLKSLEAEKSGRSHLEGPDLEV